MVEQLEMEIVGEEEQLKNITLAEGTIQSKLCVAEDNSGSVRSHRCYDVLSTAINPSSGSLGTEYVSAIDITSSKH